ncbi:hypothetical protein SUDANB120_02680 [Streptomyces sp. enrichment culture]|uniref:hypothetical protein n=1 Tax=Streptomyces TaxID=1883 RepID=UPI001672D6BD|nr:MULTISPECIES: hypothetical protein [Streptomyces]MBD3579117.1 hypothetical protein [Streptomyces sp. KD18]GGT00218.1 hypothetical protein GCM10010286_26460 [Streptomyces toxytricini]
MPTTLPIPIQFVLPEGWRPAPPDEVGAPDAAFVALHPEPDAGFTANITIDGDFWSAEEETLTDIADGSVERLRRSVGAVQVAGRRPLGSEDSPGLAQRLTLTAVVGGVPRELVQSQVYLAMQDAADPHKRVVIRLILTVTAAQEDAVRADFQEFLRSVAPDPGTPGTDTAGGA